MRKIIKYPSPNLLGAYEQFTKETGEKEIKLGEFLTWLQSNTIERKRGENENNQRVHHENVV